MSATLLTVFPSSHVSGLDITANAVAADGANGNAFVNSGGQSLIIINAGASPCVVTKVYGPGASFDGTTPTNPTVTVPAGHTMELGPFPPGLYSDVNGRANFTFNQVVSVTLLARILGS